MALVSMSLIVLGWPVVMRLMRSSVLATKEADYVVAARALGASTGRIVLKHLLPNCLARCWSTGRSWSARSSAPRRRCPSWASA